MELVRFNYDRLHKSVLNNYIENFHFTTTHIKYKRSNFDVLYIHTKLWK